MPQPLNQVVYTGTLIAAFASVALSQCQPTIDSNGGFAGANDDVHTLSWWDPDGTGPMGEHLVVGGSFTTIGTINDNGVALYDPATSTWSSIGNCDGSIFSAAVALNGDLLVGGQFQSIDGVAAANIARFDGTTWSPLAIGIPDPAAKVYTIEAHPNGDVFAGGEFQFTLPSGAVGTSMARFTNNAWETIGNLIGNVFGSYVNDIVTLPSGDLVATGFFTRIGSQQIASIARWDGSAWHPYGSGLTINGYPGTGDGLAVDSAGDLIVAGSFAQIDGQVASTVARFNGTSWTSVGTPPSASKLALLQTANGELIIAGNLQVVPGLYTQAVRYNGTSWVPLGLKGSTYGPYVPITIVELPSGDLLAGTQDSSTGPNAGSLRRWTGSSWQPIATGTNGTIGAGLAMANGDYWVTGDFTSIAGTTADTSARKVQGAWQPLGPYILEGSRVRLLEQPGNRALLVQANSNYLTSSVNYWNSYQWSSLGTFSGDVLAVAQTENGDIYAGGSFNAQGFGTVNEDALAVYSNYQWFSVDPQFNGTVTAMTVLSDGSLVIGGDLSTTTGFAGKLATYDGLTWTTVGGDLNGAPRDLEVMSNGDLIAIGDFTIAGGLPASGIASFDGTAWQALGSGFPVGNPDEMPLRLAKYVGDSLLVVGKFTAAGGVPAQNIAMWQDGAWQPYGSGADGAVFDIDTAVDGRIIAVGDFATFDGVPSTYVATVELPCPASTLIYGDTFCPSQGILQVDSAAWLATPLRTRATNLPATSATLAVFGTNAASIYLPLVLSPGQQGCYLAVQPDFLLFDVPSQGAVATALQVPNNPGLIGQMLFHQYLVIDFASPTAISKVSSTLAAAFTIGSLQ